jgi:hypothetical protein
MGAFRGMRFVSLFFVACGAASTASTTPSSEGAWTQLRITWSYGPCPDDGRSCHQLLTVNGDGGFTAAETPNAPGSGGAGEPVRRFSALDTQEVRELHRLVTAEFVSTLGSFDCAPSADASIRIEIDGPKGTRAQEVSTCGASTPPHALVEMLAHHRWAAHDAKPTNPTPPSGQGDPCDTATGCGKGLVCVAAPCVVAPCTSGSCQSIK